MKIIWQTNTEACRFYTGSVSSTSAFLSVGLSLCLQTSRSRKASPKFDLWITSFRLKSRETSQLVIRDAFVPYHCWMIAAGLGATYASRCSYLFQQRKTTSIPLLIQTLCILCLLLSDKRDMQGHTSVFFSDSPLPKRQKWLESG